MATPRKDPKDFLPFGAPTLYRPEFCQQLLDHFDVEPYRVVVKESKAGIEYTELAPNRLPTLAGFAKKIGVDAHTITSWGKVHPDFSSAITRAKTIAEDILVTNGLLGLYDSKIVVFVAKNYTDLRDVKELVIENAGEDDLDKLAEKSRKLDERIAALTNQV